MASRSANRCFHRATIGRDGTDPKGSCQQRARRSCAASENYWPRAWGRGARILETLDQEIPILFLLVQSLTTRERLGDFASIFDKFLRQRAKSSVLERDDADLSECCGE